MLPGLLSIAAPLFGVLALIGLAAGLLRNRRWRLPPLPGRTLYLRETLAVDPRRRLHIVEVGDRKLLLLTGGANDVVVGWLPSQ
jgi:flagellar protein FliO/FliZ